MPIQIILLAAAGAQLAAANIPATTQPGQPPAAAAPRPPIPRAQFLDTVRAEFTAMDANKDGKATKAEIEQFRATTVSANRMQQTRALFDQLDADKNGNLSMAEFQRIVGPMPKINVTPLLTRIDTNRDQQVTLAEYLAGAQSEFERLDTNKDGMLAPAEARAGRKTAPK